MTAEELLNPRVKVKGGWPGGNTKTGEIIPVEEDGERLIVKMFALGQFFEMGIHYKNYPHLFEPLPWWCDRKPEDMPAFVKDESDRIYAANWLMEDDFNMAFKLENHPRTWRVVKSVMCFFEPATKEEYDNYINSGK